MFTCKGGSSQEAAAVHCRARAAAPSSASLLLRNVAQSAAACGCKMKKVATAEMRRVESSSMDAVDGGPFNTFDSFTAYVEGLCLFGEKHFSLLLKD